MNRATEQARQPAGGATPPSPAVSAKGAHQAHTPGPWFVLDQRATSLRAQGWPGSADHDVLLISNYPPAEITPDHCDCIVARIDFSNREEELGESNFADALLIAAAPELLEALEAVNLSAVSLDPETFEYGFRVEWPAIQKVMAAIAKATSPPAASAPTGQAQGNVAEAGVSQGTSL